MTIEGRVIKILDNERVIVNLGLNSGIKRNMKFYIFEYGEEIEDPISKKKLGRIEHIKHRVRVDHVQDNFCVMISDEKEVVISPWFTLMADMNAKRFQTKPFMLDSSSDKERGIHTNNIIRIGDFVHEDLSE